MEIEEIKRFIKSRNYLISEHADEERIKDKITLQELEEAVLDGEVIEERLDDPRGESKLLGGKSRSGKMLHIVIGLRFKRPVIVTVYLPDQKEWISGKIRRRN
jgi:hypothetical protein